MKTLKFKPYLCSLVLSGKKTTTWRLFDDKNISEGDELSFLNADTKKEYAKAVAIKVWEVPFKDVSQEEFDGHENFESKEEMYKTYSIYYQRKVDDQMLVKIIRFKLITS